MGQFNGVRVFVYGTLKHGHGNHEYYLKNSQFLGRHMLKGKHRLVDLGAFPGLVDLSAEEACPESDVIGEVYLIDEKVLAALDLLEGNGTFYNRKKIDTPWKKAWCYYLPTEYSDEMEVPGGSWNPSDDEKLWVANNGK